MGQFKFLTQNIPDEPAHIDLDEVERELNRLTIHNRPAVFLSLNRGRATIDDNEWRHILQQQRRNLIEYMWEQGMIVHEIINQDMDGFSLRTEILF